jgi:hypothetical protein
MVFREVQGLQSLCYVLSYGPVFSSQVLLTRAVESESEGILAGVGRNLSGVGVGRNFRWSRSRKEFKWSRSRKEF